MSEFSDDEGFTSMEGGAKVKDGGGGGASCGAVQCKENKHSHSKSRGACPGTRADKMKKNKQNHKQAPPKSTPKKNERQSLLSNYFPVVGGGSVGVAAPAVAAAAGSGGKRKISLTPSPTNKKRKSDDNKKKSSTGRSDNNYRLGIGTVLMGFFGFGSKKEKPTGNTADDCDVTEITSVNGTNVKDVKNENDSPQSSGSVKEVGNKGQKAVSEMQSQNNRRSTRAKRNVSDEKNKKVDEKQPTKVEEGATSVLQSCSVSSSQAAQTLEIALDEKSEINNVRTDDNKTDNQSVTTSDEESSDEEDDSNSSQESSRSPSPSVPEGEYEVEEIWDYRQGLYFVKWRGYSEDENTWEPLSNLEHCDFLLNDFYNQRKEEHKACNGYYYENGRKRKLEVPPDPRPFVRKIRAFLDSTKVRVITDDEIKWALDKIHSGGKFLWSIQKTEQAMFDSYQKKLNSGQKKELREQLIYRDVEDRRNDQQKQLKIWRNKLNSVTKGRPTIEVENTEDLALPPSDFEYINNYIVSDGIVVPDDPLAGCDCEGGCSIGKNSCCPGSNGSKFAYRSNKRILAAYDSYMIIECNSKCTCGPECHNRVVQDGVTPLKRHKLCIFRTKYCGWGVKTLKPIRKGTFVCMYVGEILTSAEAEDRGKKYDEEGTTYLFDLDFNSSDNLYTVDARYKGNVSHFINHSCSPNLAVYGVWVDCLDVNLPKLALFAERDIEPFEELYFDYKSSNKATEPTEPNQQDDDSDEPSQRDDDVDEPSQRDDDVDEPKPKERPLIKRLECKCQSSNCRGYLFT